MWFRLRLFVVSFSLLCVALFITSRAAAAPIPVRYRQGLLHGFLVLRTMSNRVIADGELIQTTHDDQVTTRLVFHFKDGSIHDETAVYSQQQAFRLLTYHLVQKGRSFPHPVDVQFDTSSGEVKVQSAGDKASTQRMQLPEDLANGMIPALLENLQPGAQATVSMLAATPKVRIVTLAIAPQGEEEFSTGGIARKATHYAVKINIGGVAGVVAPLVGKQPDDIHVWILGGEAPTLIKMEGPLCADCPGWRIEMVAPTWPRQPRGHTSKITGTTTRKSFRFDNPVTTLADQRLILPGIEGAQEYARAEFEIGGRIVNFLAIYQ
jgi:hypothetical protein